MCHEKKGTIKFELSSLRGKLNKRVLLLHVFNKVLSVSGPGEKSYTRSNGLIRLFWYSEGKVVVTELVLKSPILS